MTYLSFENVTLYFVYLTRNYNDSYSYIDESVDRCMLNVKLSVDASAD